MATALDIVRRAHRRLGVTGQGETLQAEMAAEGLEALNAMLHGWVLHGIDIGHADLALGDTFPLETTQHEAVVDCLAARLAPLYETPVRFDADAAFRAIQAAYLVVDEITLPLPLRRMPSRRTDLA